MEISVQVQTKSQRPAITKARARAAIQCERGFSKFFDHDLLHTARLTAGLVFLSDSRTNAGVDQISVFPKNDRLRTTGRARHGR